MTAGSTIAPVVFLMGPSGAGKTRVSMDLATRFHGEIVSVDSALVYRGLDIGTAKPNPALRQRVPHHLIDICDPAEAYSAARFRADALACIRDIRARGRLPVLVGGTGLYFRALERGLSALPAADPAIRTRLQAELDADGPLALHARLAAVDPAAAARIHPNDPQRIVRALEVHALTGRTLSQLWLEGDAEPLPGGILKIVLAPASRSVLHDRIRARFRAMLNCGFVNEVRVLKCRGDLSLANPSMRAVGYRDVWRYLDGEMSQDEMSERGVVATRQLARRQLTWLRREADCTWFDSSAPAVADAVAGHVRESPVFKRSGNILK